MYNKVTVVVGGQFGSEGKGHVTGYLANWSENHSNFADTIVTRVGGPNAGHIVYGNCPTGSQGVYNPCVDCNEYGHPWRLRQIPVGAVTAPGSELIIGPGSEIDADVLWQEIDELNAAGYRASYRLMIDRSATIIEPKHKEAEAERELNARIGSTAKGIGAARADRIWRSARVAGDSRDVTKDIQVLDTTKVYSKFNNTHVIIEGTQGYGLGLNTPNYPFTTSGNCRAVDFLAQAGISPWSNWIDDFEVVIAARTHPIRVAGNSGELAGETSWEQLGLPSERTTVTHKIRRVGAWDSELVKEAARANGAPSKHVSLALTMADHVIPSLSGVDTFATLADSERDALRTLLRSCHEDAGAPIRYVGTSPVNMMSISDGDY